jgi:hypothetical protein
MQRDNHAPRRRPTMRQLPKRMDHSGQPAQGFIYVMECAGFYKIGWTAASPRKRRIAVQVSSPLPVTLVGAVEGSQMMEAEWHEAFRSKRVSGEWFALTEADIAAILHEESGTDPLPGEFDVA